MSSSAPAASCCEDVEFDQGWRCLNPEALNQIVARLYPELKRLARRELQHAQGFITLQPTALVHEAYLRIAAQTGVLVESRAHFFHLAARVMRCVVVDRARTRLTTKRGAGIPALSLESLQVGTTIPDRDLVALDHALRTLEKFDPQKCRLVELRFFAGMSIEEAADVLGISARTAARDWLVAKARLYSEIRSQHSRADD